MTQVARSINEAITYGRPVVADISYVAEFTPSGFRTSIGREEQRNYGTIASALENRI